MEAGLETLNFMRYLAGLPPVQLNEEYVDYAQHGAVLMAASGYGHTPAKPAGMDQAFYDTAYKGTSQGNIFSGYASLYQGIVHGWMADDDEGNIDRVGHRRWALNPHMGATGFGMEAAKRLGVMYAFDRSGAELDYEAIAYPSGEAFPGDIFKGSYPWSITLNPELYQKPDLNTVTVTLSGQGKTWTFSKSQSSFAGNYFNIDTAGYGVSNAIIFRPQGVENYAGTYTVTVEGVKTIGGQDAGLAYQTTFFRAAVDYPADKPSSWALAEVNRANEWYLVPDSLNFDFSKTITRAEFCRLAANLYERLKGPVTPTATFKDTSDSHVLKIASLGIVEGVGDGLFEPYGTITREQAAKILALLLEALGEARAKEETAFADYADISDWATGYVAAVSAKGIMGDAGGNRFDPKGTYTREQSIATILRIWDRMSQP